MAIASSISTAIASSISTAIASSISTQIVWQIGIVAVWLGGIILLAELLDRLGFDGPETLRKVVHIGVGNVILIAWWLGIPTWVGIAASILFSGLTLLSYRVTLVPGFESVGRKSLGTFFYAVSIGVLIAWFWPTQPHYAAIGVMVMTWGDGLAALIGQQLGRHPYVLWGMKKSWEGSLTMAIASYGVSSAILLNVQGNIWQTWCVPVAIAIVATGLEAFSKLGIDNLSVPVGSAATAFFLNEFSLLPSPIHTLMQSCSESLQTWLLLQ